MSFKVFFSSLDACCNVLMVKERKIISILGEKFAVWKIENKKTGKKYLLYVNYHSPLKSYPWTFMFYQMTNTMMWLPCKGVLYDRSSRSYTELQSGRKIIFDFSFYFHKENLLNTLVKPPVSAIAAFILFWCVCTDFGHPEMEFLLLFAK